MQFGARRRPSRRKLLVEALENRRVMATLTGNIFLDSNINGTRDPAEGLLTGQSVDVYVDLDASGTPTPGDIRATTNTGSYTIVSPLIGAGVFAVRMDPTGIPFQPTSFQSVTVIDPLVSAVVPDIGAYRLGEIQGFVFVDNNRDGIQNSTETQGLPGAQFQLIDLATNLAVGTQTTDANGEYKFTNLVAGSYRVEEVANPDRLITKSVTGVPPQSITVNASGQLFVYSSTVGTPDVNFQQRVVNPILKSGQFTYGKLYAYTYLDVNGDGIENPGDTTPFPGVNLTLTWAGPNNLFTDPADDQDNASISGVVTTVNGKSTLLFAGLDFGRYRIESTLPNGVVRTSTAFDAVYTINSSGITLAPNSIAATVGAIGANIKNNLAAGYFRTAEILVQRFNDRNADGDKQTADDLLPGGNFTLTNVATGAVIPGTVDAGGFSLFTQLLPGEYRLTEALDPTLKITTDPFRHLPSENFSVDTSGQLFIPVAGARTPDSNQIVIVENTLRRGSFRYGEIHGYVFVDKNDDGIDNNGDSAVALVAPGVTVTLRRAGPDNAIGTGDDLTPVVITPDPATGKFVFNYQNLPDPLLDFGRYQLVLNLPTGVQQTTAPIGTAFSVNDSGKVFAPTTSYVIRDSRQLPVEARPELAIGIFRLGQVSGYAYGDVNGDGVDTGNAEPRGRAVLPTNVDAEELKVKVQLRRLTNGRGEAVSEPVIQTETALNNNVSLDGRYTFSGLRGGSYAVEVQSLTPQSVLDGQPSRVFTTTSNFTIQIGSGFVVQPFAGYISPLDAYQAARTTPVLAVGSAQQAFIRGSVYLDRDGNAVLGAADLEPGLGAPAAPTFTVSIVSSGADNIFGNGNDVTLPSKTVNTNSSGLFEFNLFPHYQSEALFSNVTQAGSFRITLSQPSHFRLTRTQTATIEVTDVRLNDIILGTSLSPKNTPINADQTIKRLPALNYGVERLAAIYGVAFNDLDADGDRDAGEAVVSGQTFRLQGTSRTATSGADGVYVFEDLEAGAYVVVPTLKTDAATGQENQGRTEEYASVTASLNNVYVAPGLNPLRPFERADSSTPPVPRIGLTEINPLAQGFVQLSKVEGIIYVDANRDGIQNTGEAGQVGVKVALRRVVREHRQDELPADRLVQTDSSGKYTFFVWPGVYDVAQEKPNGFEPIGSAPTVISSPPITLDDESRQRFTDFGLLNPNSGVSNSVTIGKARWTTMAALDTDRIENDLIAVYEFLDLANPDAGGGLVVFKNMGTTAAKNITIPFGSNSRPSFASVIDLDKGSDPSGVPEIIVALSGAPGTSGNPGGLAVIKWTGDSYSQTRVATNGQGPKHISYATIGDRYYLSVVNERTSSGTVTKDVSILAQAGPNSLSFNSVGSLSVSTAFVSADVVTTAFGNFDGQPGVELAVAESALNRIEIYGINANAPAGPYPKKLTLTGLANPTHVLAGSFMGNNGVDDLVVSEYGASQFSLYPQVNGVLSEANRIKSTTLAKPGFMAAADVNKDGRTDLAVASLDSGNVQVFYNRVAARPAAGAPKFQATNSLSAWNSINQKSSLQWVSFGDVNSDGYKDLVSAPFTGSISLHVSAVTTLANWDKQKLVQQAALNAQFPTRNTNATLSTARALSNSALPADDLFPIAIGIKQPNVAYDIKSQLVNNGGLDIARGFELDNTFETSRVLKTGNARVVPAPLTLSAGIEPAIQAFDVSGNGQLDPLDALLVINSLNTVVSGEQAPAGLDVNADGQLTPLDALLIINRLNIAGLTGQSIDTATAESMVQSALDRLEAAPAILSGLSQFNVTIDDLPAGVLSWVDGNNLVIDADAAGRGWFVDSTPEDDVEFATDDPVVGVDLLSVVTHELGHLLGLEDMDGSGEDEIMHSTLRSGERRLSADAVDRLLGNLL